MIGRAACAEGQGSTRDAAIMAKQRTLSIIKPDAMEKQKNGAILAQFQENGFTVVALKQIHLTRKQGRASTPSTASAASSASSSTSCRVAP